MDLLLIGQKSAYSFLVCGVAQVDGIHFQYSVSNTQPTLTCKTMRNHLMVRSIMESELRGRTKGNIQK